MLFHRKQPVDWTIIALGIIAIGIVVSVVFAIVFFLQRADNTSDSSSDDQYVPPAFSNAADVRVAYMQDMEDLLRRIRQRDESLLLVEIEQVLFGVRVPAEKRDVHFAAAVEVQTFRAARSGEVLDEPAWMHIEEVITPLVSSE